MEPTLLIKRREAIIIAAIDSIDKYGIQAVSTKEIAKKQGVSERIIFKHFPTKNDLLNGVLDYYGKYDNAIIETTQSKQMNPIDSITFFLDSFSTYYENYPAITAITQSYNALLSYPDLGTKVKDIFNRRASFIMGKVEEAKKEGIFVPDILSECIVDIINGTFMLLCLKWRINEYSFSLRESTLTTIKLVIESFTV